MFAASKRLIVWAVDGSGGRMQGRPALGVAFILVMLPVMLNVIGMAVFGYERGSAVYGWMIAATIGCWSLVLIYLVSVLAYGMLRLGQTIWDAVLKGRRGRR